jgi:O-antigen biosynthesis protein
MKTVLPKLPFGQRTYRRIRKWLRRRQESRTHNPERNHESLKVPPLPKLPFGQRTFRRIRKWLRLRREAKRDIAANHPANPQSSHLSQITIEVPGTDPHSELFARNGATAPLFPVIVKFEYSRTASPASAGLNDDSRQLAVGYRSLTLRERASGKTLCYVDFREGGNAPSHILYGFSDIEPWGTWSIGGGSAIALWLSAEPTGELELSLDAMGFKGLEGGTNCTVTTNLGHSTQFVASAVVGIIESVMQQAETHSSESFFGAVLLKKDRNNCSLTAENPLTSIIILNFNKPLLSILSALSVISSGITSAYEILIVDNGSSPINYEVLRTARIQVRVVRLPVNRFFGEGNNLGAEQARGKFLLFLNNDAFLAPGCVDALLQAFESQPRCGAAGPVFCYPDGSLQEAGAFVHADGSALQRGKFNKDFDLKSLSKFEAVDYVSAACLMMRADRFSDLGGFNYRFDPAYYEDTDLCFRLRLRDEIVFLVRDAKCFHIENATTSDKKNNSGAINIVGHNKAVFMSIWGPFLANRTRESLPISLLPTHSIERRETRLATQATFSPYPLVPGGGERYILATTLALNERAPAAFVTPDPYSRLRLDSVMFDLGLRPGLIDTCDIKSIASARLERFVLMGNEVYPSRSVPAEKSFFMCQFPFPLDEQKKINLRQGLDRLSDFRKVIVNSEFTKKAYECELAKYGRTAFVEIVNPPVATERLLRLQRPRKPWILSIGRFTDRGHAKRQDVLIEAMKATSESFRKEWKLILCGGVPNDPYSREYFKRLKESAADSINIEFVISPPTEVIDELLAQSSVYAHGTGFGVTCEDEFWKCEHFGITIVEALAAGCQVLAYEIGGAPELFARAGCGTTYSSIEELSQLFQNANPAGTDLQTRERVAGEFGDKAFFERMTAVTQ